METKAPLYLIPGLMNDARVWARQVACLSGERVVRVADSAAHDSICDLASAALDAAPGERFALAGFSLGGYVALEMIRQAPGRIAALALVDTGPGADTPEATGLRLRMVEAVENDAANFDSVIASFLPRVVHPSRAGDRPLIDVFVAMARSVGIAGFVRQQRAAIGRIDSRATLQKIRCPTLVFCGREDQVTPLALSQAMSAAVPGATLVVAETCGHMAPLEQPDAVNDAMMTWLSR